jgi:Zn-dependent peptidase ImmA (M78 family)
MAVRVDVSPRLLAWARERSGVDEEALVRRFPSLPAWERAEKAPTLKQLEGFAQATYTPVGMFFLPEPPDEVVPIPDYRTVGDAGVARPSANLLDTIFQCQQRQEWYRDFAQVAREDPVAIVGSLTPNAPVVEAAATMRDTLGFGLAERGPTWSEALRRLSERAEAVGVLVMISGVVGSNTHRQLSPDEFRGFALADGLAPLVFVNGADTKAAQIFTLAHELAHLWLGETALSDADMLSRPAVAVERWCNQVAAEFLAPIADIHAAFDRDRPLTVELERLAKRFKVSTLVIVRRVHDAGHLSWDAYRAAYVAERDRILAILAERGASGGNYYSTQPVRISKRFTRAVIESTLEGQTLHRDALQLLGFKKVATFHELAHRLGAA